MVDEAVAGELGRVGVRFVVCGTSDVYDAASCVG